jgi:hypothetical protein
MIVNTISGGETAFNALLYKQPDSNLLNYLQNNIQSAIAATSHLGERFVSTVQNMYNRFNDSSIINASKALLFKSGSHMNQTVIYPVAYDGFSTANLMMQRYIMANPTVDKLYQRNMCYGFQDTYINNNPYTGTESVEYMQTMDGVLQFDSSDEGYTQYHSYYHSDENNTELDIYDKLSVLDTWDNLQRLIAKGIDPTDPDGGSL